MKKDSSFIVDISAYLRDDHHSDALQLSVEKIPSDDIGGIVLDKPLECDLSIFSQGESVVVLIRHLSSETTCLCSRCLKKMPLPIEVENTEYIFERTDPKVLRDIDDVYAIDMKNLEIDLSKPIFQEIVMSVPNTIYCKDDCKGLCVTCGKNLNKGACKCLNKEKEESEENTPLKGLKKMFLLAKKESLD